MTSARPPRDERAGNGEALDGVLGRLGNVRRAGGGYTARCPAHEDRENSLSIGVGDDGRVLLKCFAGCTAESIVAALGLRMADLFEPNGRGRHAAREERGGGTLAHSRATVQPSAPQPGLTLEQYAEAKRLPAEFLRSVGIGQITLQGSPALRLPYLDRNGDEVAVRFRLAMEGESRFRWRRGTKPCLYGLQRLTDAEAAEYVVLCEGESDAQTCWLHGIPALGLPGADSWREAWAEHCDGIQTIYVLIEPDEGGRAVLKWLAESRIRDRARLVDLGDAKDPSGLYLAEPDNFPARFEAALAAAVPWAEQARAEADRQHSHSWARCASLAREPRILDCFAEAIGALGVVGESRLVKLLYLAVTSRLLDRPVSMAVKGPSSAGKSFVAQRVLEFFPESAYYALSAMSEHALAYSEEPLRHRMLVIYEAVGLQGDFASYLVRSLLSEGCVRYETVERAQDGLKPRLIQREGPTGLLVTTTALRLHPENETRLFSITVTDTPEQTRNVMFALAQDAQEAPDLDSWHALQEWLEGAECRVYIPFADALAKAIPAVAVRLRRDFGTLLSLIRTHAILHQASRGRDAEGRIVAIADDYAAVRDLAAEVIAEGVEATVPDTTRETVQTVETLAADEPEGVTVMAVARKLRLDKSAAWRRVRSAIDRGYLKNLETRKGHAARLVIGEALPEETELLPAPEALAGCAVAGNPERGGGPPSPQVNEDTAEQGEAAQVAIPANAGQRPADGEQGTAEWLEPQAAASAASPDGQCRWCGGTEFWLSVYGVRICAACHPPGSEDLVAERINADANGAKPVADSLPKTSANDGRR